MAEWRDLLTPENLAALERFIAAQEERESVPSAVNGILTDWLGPRLSAGGGVAGRRGLNLSRDPSQRRRC